jgi:choline dehydrogenase-like flavoprotein
MRRHAAAETVDVVVVGTGAGGAPLTAEFARAGLRVVALEAGRNRNPNDFTSDEVAAADLYWLDERLSAGDSPQAFGANNSGIGVGGSTLHWGAFCPRPHERDLRLRSGPDPYPWDPSRHYPLPPVARNAPAQLMQRGCDAIGLRTADAPAALLSRDLDERQACVGCGACHQGCRNGAKASMDVTYLPAAVAHGAEIRDGCQVHDIERDRAGAVTGVIYRQDGIDHRIACRALFLCAGAVETPRLLLHTDIANASGQVGRNYMAHVATQVWGTFEAETRPNHGYPSSLISEEMIRPHGAEFAGGYLMQSLGVLPVTWANSVARGRGLWGRPLVDYLDRYNHVAGLGINGESLPYDGNFLELADETDASGMRKPRIHFSYGRNERAMHDHASRLLTQISQAAGGTDIWTLERSAHTIGTCRMGTDPADSVVDPNGRAHDVSNLWICDNSVFPSALAANPALTIMALSLRTAAAFLAA